MKKTFYLLMAVLTMALIFNACKKDEDNDPFKQVKIGAQDNASNGGFYSVSENKVYTMDQAFLNQGVIDILCFYEASNGNNIAIASPGSNITGIFTGASSVENWTTTDTTYFCKTTLTVAQYDALTETDQLIVTSFDPDNKYRKAKDLKVDDIYAFQTKDGNYGMFKITEVIQGTDGSAQFDLIVKK